MTIQEILAKWEQRCAERRVIYEEKPAKEPWEMTAPEFSREVERRLGLAMIVEMERQ